MDNYDTLFLYNKSDKTFVPYDKHISSILPNIFNDSDSDKFIKNDITNLNYRNEIKRENDIYKYLNKSKILYTIIYKTYQNGILVDIFFLLNKKNDKYDFIENIKNVYNVDKEIIKDLYEYKSIWFNDKLIKILIINNLEYNLENNNFGWASLYEIINSNKLNGLDIERNFINFLSDNLMYVK
jgi:hypothetical protein